MSRVCYLELIYIRRFVFMGKLNFKDLGMASYSDVYKIQTDLFNQLLNKKIAGEKTEGVILFCEHQHVFTIGKSGDDNNLLVDNTLMQKKKIDFFHTDRGGDITYHGPGQIVVYPIIDLDNYKKSPKEYVYILENSIIEVLSRYGIKGEISQGNIGVWLDVGTAKERKICSVGVKISRKICMHGLALNVNTDLAYFDYINPCGFTDKQMTSMQKELGKKVDAERIKSMIKNELVQRLPEAG